MLDPISALILDARAGIVVGAPPIKAKLELAWAAGFFDGEGSLSTTSGVNGRTTPSGRTIYRRYSASIQQSGHHAKVILDRFQRAIGGYGNVRGPYIRKGGRLAWKPFYQWHAFSKNDIRETVKALWPYLGPAKREQAMRVFKEWGSEGVAASLAGQAGPAPDPAGGICLTWRGETW